MQHNNNKQKRQSKQAAFTLVELLLVLVILATLAAIVIPKFAGRSEQARVTAAQTQIANLEIVLDAFEVDNGFYPKGSSGLEDLVNEPSYAKDWRGPYMDEVPIDPWDNEYIYEYPGKHNTRGFDLYSMGPDGRAGGDDDITNWNKSRK